MKRIRFYVTAAIAAYVLSGMPGHAQPAQQPGSEPVTQSDSALKALEALILHPTPVIHHTPVPYDTNDIFGMWGIGARMRPVSPPLKPGPVEINIFAKFRAWEYPCDSIQLRVGVIGAEYAGPNVWYGRLNADSTYNSRFTVTLRPNDTCAIEGFIESCRGSRPIDVYFVSSVDTVKVFATDPRYRPPEQRPESLAAPTRMRIPDNSRPVPKKMTGKERWEERWKVPPDRILPRWCESLGKLTPDSLSIVEAGAYFGDSVAQTCEM